MWNILLFYIPVVNASAIVVFFILRVDCFYVKEETDDRIYGRRSVFIHIGFFSLEFAEVFVLRTIVEEILADRAYISVLLDLRSYDISEGCVLRNKFSDPDMDGLFFVSVPFRLYIADTSYVLQSFIASRVGVVDTRLRDAPHFVPVAVEVVEELHALDPDDLLGVDLEGMHEGAGLGGDRDGSFGVGDVFKGAGLPVDLGDLDHLGVGGGVVDALEGFVLGEGRNGRGVPLGDPELLELLFGGLDANFVADDLPVEGLGVPYLGYLQGEVRGGVAFLLGVELVFVAGGDAHGAEVDGGHGEEGEKIGFHGG